MRLLSSSLGAGGRISGPTSAMASLLTASLEAVCLSSRHAPGAPGAPPRRSALLLVLPEARAPLALERLTQAALLNYRCSTWSGTYIISFKFGHIFERQLGGRSTAESLFMLYVKCSLYLVCIPDSYG